MLVLLPTPVRELPRFSAPKHELDGTLVTRTSGAYWPVISYRTQSVSVSYFTVLQYCSHCGSCSRSGDLLLYRSRETRVPSVAGREQGARDTLYGVSRMTHVEPCHERYGPGTRLRTQERAQRAEFSSITNGSSPPSSRVRRPRSHSSRSWPRPPPPQWHSSRNLRRRGTRDAGQ